MRHSRSSSEKDVESAPTALALGADWIAVWTLRRARTRWRVRFWNFPLMQVGCSTFLSNFNGSEGSIELAVEAVWVVG